MLGFDVAERTIPRWMKRAPRDQEPARRWLTFLRNQREAIAAMDFFTVPTITFSALYCFFVIRHDRRRILHFNITKHPSSSIHVYRSGSMGQILAFEGEGIIWLGQPSGGNCTISVRLEFRRSTGLPNQGEGTIPSIPHGQTVTIRVQMSVVESSRILQPESTHSIKADVSDPDEGEGHIAGRYCDTF